MTIRWALVGPGRHALKNVLPQMKKAAGAEVVAVVSRDPARAEAIAREQGIAKIHASFDDLLKDRQVDAIYDASPDGLHAEHIVAAAKAGKHILAEKPLAISVEQGARAVEAARRHRVKLGVVLNQRHEAVHQEARRLALDGALGEVKLAYVQVPLRASSARTAPTAATWRSDPKMRPHGIVTSIGDHAYDTLAFIVGQQIEEVAAFTDASADNPKERVASLLLKLSGGAIGHAVASYITPFARRPFEIHGTKGSLIIENSYLYLVGGSTDPTPTLTLIDESGSTVQRFDATECFRLEIEQFSRAVDGAGEPMTPGEEGLQALAIGEAIYAAVASGTVTKVPPLRRTGGIDAGA